MNEAARQWATAEEWRIKYEVVTAYIDNPVVIENAERAAAAIIAMASSTPYTLEQVTEMFSEVLRRLWLNEQAERALTQPSARELADQLHKAAHEPPC